ncbi:MAG: hypothetical protein AB6733_20840 [Clostridiaceae bacterium]
MNNKKVAVSFIIIILLLSLGVYSYNSFLNSKKQANTIHSSIVEENDIKSFPVQENKYYSVHIKYNDNDASEFVPLKLNPGLKDGDSYNVSTVIDDNGNIIGDKIIVVDNFVISDENKEMIKKVAGNDYDEALKEIEDRVNETKEQLKKEGRLK